MCKVRQARLSPEAAIAAGIGDVARFVDSFWQSDLHASAAWVTPHP